MTSRRNPGSLDQLIKALDKGPGAEGYLELLRTAKIPLAELERFCTWNEKHYTRNCIAQSDAYELLLICYDKGQRTSIHDYDSEEAYVHPVEGTLLEERFETNAKGELRQVSSVVLGTESYSYLCSGHSIHRYVNVGTGRAMSLNLYASPLRKWKVYDERSGTSRTGPAGS